MKTTFECPEGKLTTFQHNSLGKIQLINARTYESIEELFRVFDFHVCQFALYRENFETKLATNRLAIRSVKKKVLTLNNVTYPVATMNRLYKYQQYGFNAFHLKKEFMSIVASTQWTEEELEKVYID